MFYVSLLEQHTIKKKLVDQANQVLPEPKKKLEFEAKDNKEYEVKAIINNAVYNQ